jgi:pimeloyl-ACP methyl ester carboxylesterase
MPQRSGNHSRISPSKQHVWCISDAALRYSTPFRHSRGPPARSRTCHHAAAGAVPVPGVNSMFFRNLTRRSECAATNWTGRIVMAVAALVYGGPVLAQLSTGSQLLTEKHLVSIGHGRSLNLVCIGQGFPTVVFEYGLGSNILHWQKIQEPLSSTTRTCFYDRAGYGFSDPARKPMTALNIVSDLHALIHNSGERLPVVLVGHSIGGLYATLYTDKFTRDVAGLVLIDPSFAGQGDQSPSAEAQRRDRADYDHEQSEDLRCAAIHMAALGRGRIEPQPRSPSSNSNT